jgi:hypothetical protein
MEPHRKNQSLKTNKPLLGGHEAEPCSDPVSFASSHLWRNQNKQESNPSLLSSKPTTIFAHCALGSRRDRPFRYRVLIVSQKEREREREREKKERAERTKRSVDLKREGGGVF